MQDNPFPAAERILADIEAVFKKDPKLAEFDVVPVNENHNKSPVLHCSHSLGLESWCVRHVFCYIYQRLMDLRKKHRKEDPGTVIRLLRGALLLNPDVASFWHMRKDLVLSSQLDPFIDLHFSAIVLSYKPKCSEAFSHRRWLISQLLTIKPYAKSATVTASNSTYSSSDALESELKVSGSAASRYANNYHAWNHRIWAIQHVCSLSSLWRVLLSEWQCTGQWVASHVSDHSGMQYRQFLLQQMISNSSVIGGEVEGIGNVPPCNGKHSSLLEMVEALNGFRERCQEGGDDFVLEENGAEVQIFENLLSFVVREFLFNTDLICRFVGHEALWCHRRFVVATLVKLVKNCVRDAYDGDLVDQLLTATQTQEQLLVRHCTIATPMDLHQIRFAKRHASWLARVLNVSVACEPK